MNQNEIDYLNAITQAKSMLSNGLICWEEYLKIEDKMAKKYNVTDCIGSNYLFENEMFNGTVIPMWDYYDTKGGVTKWQKSRLYRKKNKCQS